MDLAKSRADLDSLQQELANDRMAFQREEARHAHGRNLLQGIFEDRHSIAAVRDGFVLQPTDKLKKSALIEEQDVPEWFRPLVLTVTRFHESIDRAESSERAFHIARELTLKHYPGKADEIVAKIPSPPPTRKIYDLNAQAGRDIGG